ncbi:MAG: creatininase family protein [Planctomycetes bacterium]|nr:creatininase family protein [Planctomycetota bacterium]
MRLERLRAPQLRELSRDTIVVVPVAAIEQHGPHLPVGTDTFIADGLADATDKLCNQKLLILPVQRFGCSDHHMHFGGTLTLTHETFEANAMELIDSMRRHGFRRFFILNAHGGNQAIGGVIAERCSIKWPDLEVMFASWWQTAAKGLREFVEGEYPSIGHACEFETSMMLVLQPDLVDMKAAEDGGFVHPAPQLRGDLLGGSDAKLSIPFHKMTANGVFGRPTLATKEKGQRVIDHTAQTMKKLLGSVWGEGAVS